MRKLLGPALCSLALLGAAPVEAQQSTIPDVCAGGQMRGPDGECIPGTGVGAGAMPDGGTTASGSPSGGTAAGAEAEGATATVPMSPSAEPGGGDSGTGTADPQAGIGSGN